MKATLHPSLQTLSGTLDNWVYRNVNGQVVVASKPESVQRERTAAQVAAQQRFADAIAYAKRVLADPCQRDHYQRLAKAQQRRADKLLASDFLTPPDVERIDLSGYHGRAGDLIRVVATDDVEVVAVQVALQTTAGTTLEEGAATKVHGVWRYTATTARPADQRIRIIATATDRPGHTGVGDVPYP